MDSHELIKTWPAWSKAGAAAIVASPAFAMPMEFGGTQATLLPLAEPLEETLNLDIRFEDSTCRLSLADSPAFPDLHKLWTHRKALPKALLLAMVEAECGALLQSLENAFRLQLSICGLADDATAPGSRQQPFQLGEVRFALELPQPLMAAIGRLEYLDASHPSIRQLTREAWAEYAEFILTADEIAGLSEGDALLLEDDFLARARWVVKAPADDALHLRSTQSSSISFGDFADDTFPPCPPPASMQLLRRNHIVAEGELSTIGERKCFRLTHLR